MRILYAGSPGIAVPALQVLLQESIPVPGKPAGDFELVGVLTNPDSAKGRSGKLLPTEVGDAVQRFNTGVHSPAQPLPLFKPEKIDSTARQQIAELKPDILLSFAYGRLFGPQFLALFPLGGFNIHPSLLPKYRGATPIPAAILNRDTETGISIQELAPEMDSGDIVFQESIPLNGRETTASFSEIIAEKAAQILPGFLHDLTSGTLTARAQNHLEASYCSLITMEDGAINWEKSALEIDAHIRAFNPWPLGWTMKGTQRLFILKAEKYGLKPDIGGNSQSTAANTPGLVLGIDKQHGILVQTGEGILAITELQYSSKKALYWRDFLNGARDFVGSLLSG